MDRPSTTSADGVSRRSLLAAGVTGAVLSTSGCIDRVQSVVDDGRDDQFSLSIMTVPADEDREVVRMVRHLEENLEAAGIGVSIDMRSQSSFLEAVLIDHDFDCYIGRHPADYDPDFLYEALHSAYLSEAGWQNPFGYSSIRLDTALDDQRRTDGSERRQHVATVLRELAQEKPFEPICMPDENRLVRTDRFEGWNEDELPTRTGYLGLDVQSDDPQLHALSTDARLSQDLNPLSVPLRQRGTTVELVYDSLAIERDGELVPWLAADWEWFEPGEEPDEVVSDQTNGSEGSSDGTESDETGDDDESDGSSDETEFDQRGDVTESEETSDTDEDASAMVVVTLREDCLFHDGEPVTADDVAFTYRFLADTALDRAAVPSPAPRYRSHVDAIESVTVEDEYRLTVTTETNTAVTERAFTVPILPADRWREQVLDRADSDEFSPSQGAWGPVSMDNLPATGSGPYKYDSSSDRNYLTLERFDDHFTRRDDVDLPEATAEELRVSIDPGDRSAVDRMVSGNADVTASMIGAHAISSIPDNDDLQQVSTPSQTFYHLGFNTRTAPFSNPRFRRAIAQLIDKEWIVESVFDGHARPVAAPVAEEWVPERLVWEDEDPIAPFAGTDGELDVEQAREAFTDAGYQYDQEGRLLTRY